MADGHCFISYSNADALQFATNLADALESGFPFINAWLDKRDIIPGPEWDDQLLQAIRSCKCLLFIMSRDSVADGSGCKMEWTRSLSYKKPIALIRLHSDIEIPLRLDGRQWIDFSSNFEAGMAKLRGFVQRLDSPEGILDNLKYRLIDAQRDLRRATEEDRPRIEADIEELKSQIQLQEKIVANPEAAEAQTQKNIETGLERERKPERPTAAQSFTKFINPPPGVAPGHFQDRYNETREVVRFLNDNSQRLLTVVGRGGVGKTAMVCRLLKSLESGELPDGLGVMAVDGIVYLSESGSHRVNFANIFYDLCKLLPNESTQELDIIYRNPQASTASKTSALADRFTTGRVILLLDNVEPLINVETFAIGDAELDESLCAFLHGAHTSLKIIITTRIAPRGLNLCEPGRQRILNLDIGLEPKYAAEMLREMDDEGKLGLKAADPELLNRTHERTLGYPRALEALFAILASDRYTALEELLAMPTPENVVEALVGEAFSRLDVNAQKVMQALAVYNRPVTPAAVDYLLAPHLPAIDSAPILQRLANMHFARKESGRFYLHPVDREFAFGLIPEKDLTTKDTKVTKEEPKAEKSASEIDDILSQLRKLQDTSSRALAPVRGSRFDAFTQHDLTSRAADYFKQARKPRAEWKKLDDLSAQLAEFDLRCAAGDYDAAASVLIEIEFDYLFLWGHYRMMIDLHLRIKNRLRDKKSQLSNLNGLGISHDSIGKVKESIAFYQEGLSTAREAKYRNWEDAFLGNIGGAYFALSIINNAIEYWEQALVIARDIGDKLNEGRILGNLGSAYLSLGNIQKAIELYEQRIVIAHEVEDQKGKENVLICLGISYSYIGNDRKSLDYCKQALTIIEQIGDRRNKVFVLDTFGHVHLGFGEIEIATKNFKQAVDLSDEIVFPIIQTSSRYGLAEIFLLQNDLVNARATIEAALQYDVPENNHNVSALHGIIALRQADDVAARGAFVSAIGQADEILSKAAEYYEALDAKGLALCGLAITDNGQRTMDDGDGQSSMVYRQQAIETFQKARKIAPHAGVVCAAVV